VIRLVLVDDEPLVRQGLRSIFESEVGLAVVGEAGDGAEAVSVTRRLQPDVVCMDVRMPDVDGIRATELLLGLPQPPKVLVITTFSSDDYVFGALRAGAAGFLLKRASAEELVAAVRTVAAGDGLLFPEAIRELARQHRPREHHPGPALSRREAEVLALMAEGLSNAAVAERLVVGVETVRSHVAAVLRKLGARDRTHAVVLAYSRGLVEVERPASDGWQRGHQ
jgi:DNA-binding NarL/FixJ family response regulator